MRGEQLPSELKMTVSNGFDVILDPQGTTMLNADLATAAAGARIIIFGNATGTTPGALPDLPRLFTGNVSIGAFSLQALSAAAPGLVRASLCHVLTLLDEGALSVPITYLPGLDAVPDAQQALADGHANGKYVVSLHAQSDDRP